MIQKIKGLFSNRYFVLALWFGLSLIATIKMVSAHAINNYYIYKYTFFHLIHQQNLYLTDPAHYFDTNHYGPFFALIIAPFALMPDVVGSILWTACNCFILYYAVTKLPLDKGKQTAVLLICAHELMTASFNVQSNALITALILFSFIFIRKEKDFWAACMIMIGVFIKLYGIVGLAFFFFSDHKLKFILSLMFWACVLFVLPMAFSSPHYIMQSYHDWFNALSEKDTQNAIASMQDISVKGMIRRIFNIQLSNLWVLAPAVIVFIASYIRIKNWNNLQFQMLILASTLIFPVIYSSSSESPTFIIAFIGVAIWFVNLNRPVSRFEWFLLIFAIIVTSFSPSDLFPKYLRTQFTMKYALKVLPCFMIWLKIIDETWTRKFETDTNETNLVKA